MRVLSGSPAIANVGNTGAVAEYHSVGSGKGNENLSAERLFPRTVKNLDSAVREEIRALHDVVKIEHVERHGEKTGGRGGVQGNPMVFLIESEIYGLAHVIAYFAAEDFAP